MAKRSNGGNSSKPARPAGRRRTDKAPQRAAASVPDKGGVTNPDSMSLRQADYSPSPAEVQQRAYDIYLQRGGGHGRDLDDWYEAERQLRRQEGREPARG